MLREKVEEALNEQLKWELYSAYLYLSMAAYFENLDLNGFAHWMKMQAQEELIHAMKFFDFISGRGGKVRLQPIKGPETEWESPLAAFEHVYTHETHVTDRINSLLELAMNENDHATVAFLQWFISEQVEEEASADSIVKRLKIAGGSGEGLLLLDRELAQRPAPQVPVEKK